MYHVALRKESVDRNGKNWRKQSNHHKVALRKESVDRNSSARQRKIGRLLSLSARRAWIEMVAFVFGFGAKLGRSPQGERG